MLPPNITLCQLVDTTKSLNLYEGILLFEDDAKEPILFIKISNIEIQKLRPVSEGYIRLKVCEKSRVTNLSMSSKAFYIIPPIKLDTTFTLIEESVDVIRTVFESLSSMQLIFVDDELKSMSTFRASKTTIEFTYLT